MKEFNASDMTHKRGDIFEAAKSGGAIIQRKNTNGVVLEEFVMITAEDHQWFIERAGSNSI